MPFDEASEGVCSVDVVENIAAGGLCFEETESVVKCGPKKTIAVVYLIFHLSLSITNAVLERMAIDACYSKEFEKSTELARNSMRYNNTNTNNNVGLEIWEGSFWLLLFVIIPLQIWLLVYGLLGLRYCPCKFNPFCFCFKKEDSQSSKYKNCMEVNLLLFLMFDDFVHIFISIGRMSYKSHSVASEIAFRQAFEVNVAMYLEIAADVFNLLYRWASFYWFFVKYRTVEEQRGHKMTMISFRPFQFLVTLTSLYFAVVLVTGLSSLHVAALVLIYVGWMMGLCFLTVVLTVIIQGIHSSYCSGPAEL